MRSPRTITNQRPTELLLTFAEVGIAILIGCGLAMTGVLTSLEAHGRLLSDWLLHGGALALGIGIGAGLGHWWTRHGRQAAGRHPSVKPMTRSSRTDSTPTAHHA